MEAPRHYEQENSNEQQKGNMIKNIGRYHQNKIKKQAIKDPIGSYFFGGFDLLPEKQKKEVRDYLKNKKNSN